MTEQSLTGLSEEEEAQRALAQWGANERPSPGRRGLAKIAAETLREPLFMLLLSAAGLYLFLGSLGERIFLLLGACAAIALVVVQEVRSERALSALRELAQPHTRLMRDGAWGRRA